MSADRSPSAPTMLLGELVVCVEPCRWGFTNVTAIVTLSSGRLVVLQRIAQLERAATILRLTHTLPELLILAGIPCPRLLMADLHVNPPLLVREYIPGMAANSMLGDDTRAIALATAMGSLLPRLSHAQSPDWLDHTWADPHTLAVAATIWLAEAQPLLSADTQAALAAELDILSSTWVAGQVLAHGDFCPVNAIAVEETIVALVDLELARVAGPYFDAAWWGWVVRYHHPERWRGAWPHLLAAAGLPDTTQTARHVLALQRLRCLELLVSAQRQNLAATADWVARLEETLQWM